MKAGSSSSSFFFPRTPADHVFRRLRRAQAARVGQGVVHSRRAPPTGTQGAQRQAGARSRAETDGKEGKKLPHLGRGDVAELGLLARLALGRGIEHRHGELHRGRPGARARLLAAASFVRPLHFPSMGGEGDRLACWGSLGAEAALVFQKYARAGPVLSCACVCEKDRERDVALFGRERRATAPPAAAAGSSLRKKHEGRAQTRPAERTERHSAVVCFQASKECVC